MIETLLSFSSFNITPVELVIRGFAVWRLTHMLMLETGPWRVFTGLRSLCGIRHDDSGEPIAWPDGFIGELLGCHWCWSVWVAALVLALPLVLCAILALSGISIMIELVTDRLSNRGF